MRTWFFASTINIKYCIFQILISYRRNQENDENSLFNYIKQCISYDTDTDDDSNLLVLNSETRDSHNAQIDENITTGASEQLQQSHATSKNGAQEEGSNDSTKNEEVQPKKAKQMNIKDFFKESPKE